MKDLNIPQREQMLGHPTGLFTLFFAELWERFSYYGMRALLVFYMSKGFLGYGDGEAYTIYGAYTALVYMTPFFGGMIADRLLGARRAVILGGLFMAGGHLLMTVEDRNMFFGALALLIVGNGFFKPNISTMVDSLYPEGSPKRDGGFTIFYIGINLGAASAPLLCAYIGETYGWHKGFGLATVGMLTGLAVFVAPNILAQLLLLFSCVAASLNIIELEQLEAINPYLNAIVSITMVIAGALSVIGLGKREAEGKMEIDATSKLLTIILVMSGAIGIGYAMFVYHPDEFYTTLIFQIVAVVLVLAALISCAAIAKAGLPAGAGAPPSTKLLNEKQAGMPREWLVYLLALLSVPVFTMLVSGFEPIWGTRGGVQLLSDEQIDDLGLHVILKTIVKEGSRPAGLILLLAGLGAFAFFVVQITKLGKVQRERMFVVMVLTFFSMLFWSFFEQAGSSVNNFTDRNVTRVVSPNKVVEESDVGNVVKLRIPVETQDEALKDLPVLTQAFLGFENGSKEMDSQVAEAIRLVQRGKIEERKKDVEYSESVDNERTKIVNLVWEQLKDQFAEEDKEKRPKDDDIKAAVKAEIEKSVVVSPESDEATDTAIAQLTRRVKAENDIVKILAENRFTMTKLTALREYVLGVDAPASSEAKTVTWQYTSQNIGLKVGGSEIPASIFQSVNPLFILVLGLVFTLLWDWMNRIGIEPSTPVKFALGLIQLGLGFACFWVGAATAGTDGMSALSWLILGYLLQTTGELCLSPVGLSMVTKLSPGRLVSTVMGTWFLATAFSQFLAAIIAQFTGVSHGSGEASSIPVPSETVTVYGDVFKIIAWSAVVSGVFCLILSPMLKKWMHEGVDVDE